MVYKKHFTLNKNFSNFRDHQLSADPEDLKVLVKKIRHCEVMLGTTLKEKIIQPSEKLLEQQVRRSIALNRDLNRGDAISPNDLTWIRPGTGISPGNEHLVVGKTLQKSLRRGSIIYQEDIL